MIQNLPTEVLDQPIAGAHLGGARTLGELVGEPTLLAFLRHCG